MNFYEHLGMTHEEFAKKYENTGLVERRHHMEFPLDLLCYSRKCVHENVWDKATSLCRGIIITRGQEGHDGGEIIARPFEKFHNYGAIVGEYAGAGGPQAAGAFGEPVVWEKMDGFMCTMYRWENKDYIASKGSFHSIHAKWATAQIRAKFGDKTPALDGKTFVFEGLHKDLRIVIDYKERQELVLLAVIDNETGDELPPAMLVVTARTLGFNTPERLNVTLEQARETSLQDDKCDEEGYVLTWYRDGVPPFRLKMKFIEYLRLHRMVTGVSPKRIWEVLATKQTAELKEYLSQSTPWFSKFVQKWMTAMRVEYERIYNAATAIYNDAREACRVKVGQRPYANMGEERKAYAHEFLREPNKEFSGVCFAMLDGKQIAPVIWKMVRRMTHGANPMVDAHNT